MRRSQAGGATPGSHPRESIPRHKPEARSVAVQGAATPPAELWIQDIQTDGGGMMDICVLGGSRRNTGGKADKPHPEARSHFSRAPRCAAIQGPHESVRQGGKPEFEESGVRPSRPRASGDEWGIPAAMPSNEDAR